MLENNLDWIQVGYFNLAYHENHGIIMGSFTKLPIVLRSVFLSTIGISIITSFPLIMSLFRFNSKKIILGISMLFGGILGNVTDRILYGFVIAMIYIKTSSFTSPVVNISDLSQWIDYVFIAQGFFLEINHHLPEENRGSVK